MLLKFYIGIEIAELLHQMLFTDNIFKSKKIIITKHSNHCIITSLFHLNGFFYRLIMILICLFLKIFLINLKSKI